MKVCAKATPLYLRVLVCKAIITLIAAMSARAQYSQYKMVQGEVVPINSRDWTPISDRIEVSDFRNGVLLCRTFTERDEDIGLVRGARGGNAALGSTTRRVKTYGEPFALTNYPGARGFTKGTVIHPPIRAMRVGSVLVRGAIEGYHSSTYSGTITYTSSRGSGIHFDLYDYGVDYTPPVRKLTPEEAAAATAQTTKQNARAIAATLKFEEEQAENGKDLYQYRLGVRYLKGDGVIADRTKALDYLSKAAAQGNEDAKKELAKQAARRTE